MPHVVAMTCPDCRSEARFAFGIVAEIAKKDLAAFAQVNAFDVVQMKTTGGSSCPAAVFYPGLHGDITSALKTLPDGYAPDPWTPSGYGEDSHCTQMGVLSCARCGRRRKHELRWPDDAYFQIEHKGQVLWAFNRDTAVDLLHFITADNRDFHRFTYRNFLMKVPSVFLSKKVRGAVAKKLERLLRPAA